MRLKDSIKISFITVLLLVISSSIFYFIGKQEMSLDNYDIQHIPKWGYPFLNKTKISSSLEGKSFYYNLNTFYLRDLRINVTSQDHFIMAGGSNTFGQNLRDNETLSSILNKTISFQDFNQISLSSPGWGPANVLSYMQSGPFKEIHIGKNGFFVFNFINSHFDRTCGLDQGLYWSRGILPNFSFDKKLEYLGLFRDNLKFNSFLIRAGVYKSIEYISKKEKIFSVLPSKKVNTECINLTAQILIQIKNEYNNLIPKGKFLVSLFPTMNQSKNPNIIKLKETLLANGIILLDFQNDSKKYGEGYRFSDYHVNKLANERHVKLLIDYLKSSD